MPSSSDNVNPNRTTWWFGLCCGLTTLAIGTLIVTQGEPTSVTGLILALGLFGTVGNAYHLWMHS